MKRNNIFMWTYIVAIILCSVYRTSQEISSWSAVVLAVTVSSMFFALEDLLISINQILQESNSYAERYIAEVKSSLDKECDILARVSNKITHVTKSKEKIERIHRMHSSFDESIGKVRSQIQEYEKHINVSNKFIKNYHWFEYMAAFSGFFSIFLIMFFPEKIQVSAVNQEQLTVLSFAVVLITRQINQYVAEKITRNTEAIALLMEQREESINKSIELEETVDNLSKRREQEKEEATADAH